MHWLPQNENLMSSQDNVLGDEYGGFGDLSGQGQDYSTRSLESNMLKWPVEGSFDWFSWDSFESQNRAGGSGMGFG